MNERNEISEYRLDPDELEAFACQALIKAGVATEHARCIAHALVRADLRGVDSHGVARLETYVKKFEAGGFNADPDITVKPVGDAAVIVDADHGPGQSAGVEAMDEAMERARNYGIGVAAVTNSNHFGTAAYYTERASDEGLVGISMTNVGSDVAPFGGVDAFMGTNPISVSVPTDRAFPITLDMATSTVAMGKIDHAAKEDETIPNDWALDENGNPAQDPQSVAALRPMGGPKGFGLAIVVDVLCGILTGAGTSPTIGALYDDFDESMELGHFVAAIDVDRFRDLASFREAVGGYIDRIKSQRTKDGIEEIRVPGELESMQMERNRKEGITLNEDGQDGVARLAERYNLEPPQRV